MKKNCCAITTNKFKKNYFCSFFQSSKSIYLIIFTLLLFSYPTRTATCGIYINAGRENAVASTKAFSSQVTVLTLMAIYFSKLHHKHRKDTPFNARKGFF
jgi:glucosamine 6-phosphate synthetase-like amidotransferase/phosphosugar isomerase protein